MGASYMHACLGDPSVALLMQVLLRLHAPQSRHMCLTQAWAGRLQVTNFTPAQLLAELSTCLKTMRAFHNLICSLSHSYQPVVCQDTRLYLQVFPSACTNNVQTAMASGNVWLKGAQTRMAALAISCLLLTLSHLVITGLCSDMPNVLCLFGVNNARHYPCMVSLCT